MNSHGQRFLNLLCVVLLGYTIMGKSFAYLGVAPLYIGEIAMLYAVFAVSMQPDWSKIFLSGWLWPLLAFMAWGACRTFPFVGQYGVDALHDGAVWMWGTFAICISILLAAEPRRLVFIERKFRTFAKIMLVCGPPAFLIPIIFPPPTLPNAPWADVPYILVKGGDLIVHLSGAVAFAVLLGGLETWFVALFTVINLALYFTGRAAMVTFGVSMILATAIKPRSKIPWAIFGAMALGLALMWVTNFRVHTEDRDIGRDISADQIFQNVYSIFYDSDNVNLSGSKEWRLNWWDKIETYTLHGKYFWGGKGFGVNLADDDGFQVEQDHSLRNPHNGHMTMLARGGVPMLALWILVQLTLGYALLSAVYSAKRKGENHWFSLLMFIFIYWTAYLINASFDVFIEGPVGGIWFWCVYGLGMGATWIYRHDPESLHIATAQAEAEELASRNRRLARRNAQRGNLQACAS